MAQLSGDAVKRLAREIFDYEISDHHARAAANTAGAMLTLSRGLATLPRPGIGPAFGYGNLIAEAEHLHARKV
ncbi:MAG TPA: hypothetical protein VMT64_03335 [Candidatus Binataceae bacterium]|nr:hypothetical protein [Candidatus Binataceae bacterium]